MSFGLARITGRRPSLLWVGRRSFLSFSDSDFPFQPAPRQNYRRADRASERCVIPLPQRPVHQIRDPPGDGQRRGQSGRVDSGDLNEARLPPVAADQEVRERPFGRGAALPDAAAPEAELLQLEVGQQPAGRRVERGERLAVRFVVVLARLVAGGGVPASRCPAWFGSGARRGRGRSGRAADRPARTRRLAAGTSSA